MDDSPAFHEDLDASDLLCPLPVLKARKRLNAMAPGTVLRVRATDPAAVVDMPHFCVEAGHELLSSTADGAARVYFIRRSGSSGGQMPKDA